MTDAEPTGSLARSPTLGLSQGQRRTLQRGALRVLLASLAVSALMGCVALFRAEFGEIEGKLLLSVFTVFGASATTLACGLAWERGRLGVVPPLGIALCLFGFLLLLFGIWVEPDIEDDWLWRAFFTEMTLAFAATHASLVAVFGMGRRHQAVFATAYGLNVFAVLLTLAALWAEDGPGDEFWRVYGAVFVLLIAVTIAIPVLRRLAGAPADEAPEGPGNGASVEARFCPNCAARLDPPGADSCTACGASFEVRLTVV